MALPPALLAALAHCYCGALELQAVTAAPVPRIQNRYVVSIQNRYVVSLYEGCLMNGELLALMCCGGTARAACVQLLRQAGLGRQRVGAFRACVIKRVAATRVARIRDCVFEQGCALHRACQFAAAAACFDQACNMGHSRAHAHLSWMMMFGRHGVPKDKLASFELADRGVRFGCSSSKGALSNCMLHGQGCPQDAARSLQLARESAAAGCSYGQFVMGKCYRNAVGGVLRDLAAAAAYYRAAAAQGLAEAQYSLGLMHQQGCGVEHNYHHAMRWYQAAAAQGQPLALHAIGTLCESGLGVAASTAEAISWFSRAADAGDCAAQEALKRYRGLLLR
jgi:TPR repeat protein